MSQQLFIEHIGQDGKLYIWCVEYELDVSFINVGLFFHQLKKIPHFNHEDIQFQTVINHPIHGEITQAIISDSIAKQFYADLPSKRRAATFQGRKVKFLLIDVYHQQGGIYREQRYSNALIFLLEHYNSARVKQEFESLGWSKNGTTY